MFRGVQTEASLGHVGSRKDKTKGKGGAKSEGSEGHVREGHRKGREGQERGKSKIGRNEKRALNKGTREGRKDGRTEGG
jgi:hypothetical protein